MIFFRFVHAFVLFDKETRKVLGALIPELSFFSTLSLPLFPHFLNKHGCIESQFIHRSSFNNRQALCIPNVSFAAKMRERDVLRILVLRPDSTRFERARAR